MYFINIIWQLLIILFADDRTKKNYGITRLCESGKEKYISGSLRKILARQRGIHIYMVHAAVTRDYYSADWLRLKKRKSRKMIGTVEVKKKADMDRKD